MFDVDLSELDREDRKALFDEYTVLACALADKAEKQRAAIGRMNAQRHRAVDAMGPMTVRLGAYEYYHEQFLGHDQRDPDFYKSRYFRNKYPHAAVNSGGTKFQVGYRKMDGSNQGH